MLLEYPEKRCNAMKNRNAILQVCKELKKYMVPYSTTTLLIASRNFIIVYLTAYLSLQIILAVKQASINHFISNLTVFFILLLVYVLTDSLLIYAQSIVIDLMTNQLRHCIHNKVLRARLSAIDAIGTRTDAIARINQDVTLVAEVLQGKVLLPLMYLVSGIGATVSITAISWKITVVLYILGLLILVFQIRLGKKMKRIAKQKQTIKAAILQRYDETAQNSLYIKIMRLGSLVLNAINLKLIDYHKVKNNEANISAWISALNSTKQFLQYAGIIILGWLMYKHGRLGVEYILYLAELAPLVINMLTSFGDAYISLQQSLVGFERINEMLALPEENLLTGTNVTIKDSDDLLCAKDASIRFANGNCGYTKLTLTIPQKAIVGITGNSGSGKSSLMRVILGLYENTEGIMRLWGQPIKSYNKKSLREAIAYVPQDDLMVAGTIYENLMLGIDMSKVKPKDINLLIKKIGISEWIYERGGYDVLLSDGGDQLSGGQRQMLAIARVLLSGKQLLILDEAFAGIDAKHIQLILDNLQLITKFQSVIIVSHDEMVLKKCDVVLNI